MLLSKVDRAGMAVRSRIGCAGAVALASLLMAPRASAQTERLAGNPSDVVKRFAVGLSTDRELDQASRELATTVAAQIGAFIEAPAHLTIDKPRGPSDWKDASGTYHSDGLLSIAQLALDLGPSGRVQHIAIDSGTGSPEVDHAVLAAAAAADSAGVYPAAPNGPAVRRVRLWLLTATAPASTWAAPLFMVSGRVPADDAPAQPADGPTAAVKLSAEAADSVRAAESAWLTATLPKVTNVQATYQIGERLGGTGPMPARMRVSRVARDRCMLTLERVYEIMVDGSSARIRGRDLIPLDRVNLQSIGVQQQPLEPGPNPMGMKSWRVVFGLIDGSIRSDVDGRSQRNATALEILMTNRDAALEVASHLQSLVRACQ
ncbi:MAG TPA: hypothetical protein VFS33_02585 [Gemmatimonadales bacterium]|nr:hypothetical protein [Gemmatimonadales bacterium]